MIGQRFGRLVVTARSWYPEHVEVICDCGEERTVRTTNLRDGHTQSCGCKRADANRERMGKLNALPPLPAGTRSGRLVTLEESHGDTVRCRCDCGREVTQRVTKIRHKVITSCGCSRHEPITLSTREITAFRPHLAQHGRNGLVSHAEARAVLSGKPVRKVAATKIRRALACKEVP